MKRVSCTFNGGVINLKSGQGYIILQIQSKLHFCVINRIKKAFCLPIFATASKKQSVFLQGEGNRNFIAAVLNTCH